MKKYYFILTVFFTLFITGISVANTHASHTTQTTTQTSHSSHGATATEDDCDCKNCKCEKCQCEKCTCEHCPGKHVNPYGAIMDKMMVDMDKVSTTTNVEINFLEQMIIHHKGAVEMAEHEIKTGKDFGMIQLAKSILAEQNSEIEKMQYLITLQKESKNGVTKEYLEKMHKTMTKMMANTPTPVSENLDIAFAEIMMPHHEAAIDMAIALMEFNPEPQVLAYSKKLISDQQVEINQMKEYLSTIKK